MRYKAGYKPSDLLCPTTYSWVRISDELLAALGGPRPCLALAALPGATVFPRTCPEAWLDAPVRQ